MYYIYASKKYLLLDLECECDKFIENATVGDSVQLRSCATYNWSTWVICDVTSERKQWSK